MSRIENRPQGVAAGASAKIEGIGAGASAEVHGGNAVLDTARSVFESAVDTAKRLNPIQPQIDAITSFVHGVVDAFNVDKNIDALGEGDSYTVGLGANGSVEGGKAYEKSEIEVKKNADGSYTLSVNGEVGAGIYGQLGGSAGGKLSVDGEATLGAGGKVEMTFKNAEDAKKALALLGKQAASNSACAMGGSLPGGAMISATKKEALTAEEQKFLNDSVSAVELKGNLAGQVKGSLGITSDDTSLVGGQLGLNAKAEDTLRIEYKDGKPAAIVLKQELSGEVAGNGGIGATVGKAGEENGAGQGGVLGGGVKTTVTVERRFELPEGTTIDALKSDPVGTVQRASEYALNHQSYKVTVAGEAQGQYLGNGGGKQAELSFSGKGSPEKLIASAVKEAVTGNLADAARKAGDEVQVDYSQRDFQLTGFSASPELKVMGVGFGVEVKGQRKDLADPVPGTSFSGTGTDAARRLAEQARNVPLDRAPIASVPASQLQSQQRRAIVG